ncbi:YetF domain-containing protein [Alkalibacillus salilacus]|uniref:Uncharacterized membrane protein YcaP (DUF421 family) n=1 Tax=Alkalibacillus salilacus TaxID=284582 RepID=A0ABT9VDF2_9BACI|nr:DUF421 domain-containing protein [Alkalibacillus salilacus]MDQ0158944.1 uncharacterized membrane protein YcaP (DUF421 family) [Alkalibacillus salilacus]
MPIIELISRLAIAFITLLVLTRLMGRKEIAQLTFFNFVSAISIGTIGASLAIDSSFSVTNGIIALLTWSAFTIFIGFLDLKSPLFRNTVEGQPVILIQKGEIMDKALQKVRLDLDALNTLLRKKNVFEISDVDYAIFETDGTLSVMKKETKQPLTKGNMNITQATDMTFPTSASVISDGKIQEKNLKKLNIDNEWVEQQLRLSGINSISDVFYAEVQKDGTLYIDTNNDSSL